MTAFATDLNAIYVYPPARLYVCVVREGRATTEAVYLNAEEDEAFHIYRTAKRQRTMEHYIEVQIPKANKS